MAATRPSGFALADTATLQVTAERMRANQAQLVTKVVGGHEADVFETERFSLSDALLAQVEAELAKRGVTG